MIKINLKPKNGQNNKVKYQSIDNNLMKVNIYKQNIYVYLVIENN